MSHDEAEQDQKPFVPLPAPRVVDRSDLPLDLIAFYAQNEGVGLATDCDRSVRLCRLDEIRAINGWQDLRRPSDCPPRWEQFRAVYFGISQFCGDMILYVLNAPSCPAGSILALGRDISGPGGEGPDVLETTVVLGRTFTEWLVHLEQVDWVELGLTPGCLANLSDAQQQKERRYYLSLNPGLGWAGLGDR